MARQRTRPKPMPRASLEILLTLLEGDKHGYGIKKIVAPRSGGAVRLGAGTLYAALNRLLDQGLVEELDERPDPELGSSRWRFYRITSPGREALRREVARLETIVSRARRLIPNRSEEGSP